MAMITMNTLTELRDSADLLQKPALMRERALEDGYIFLCGVMPQDVLLDLRHEIAEILQGLGWIDGNLDELLQHPDFPGIGESAASSWREFYDQVQCLRSFHALAHAPQAKLFADAICGGQHLFHPRHICRLIFPSSQRITTPPHQDYFYIGGTPDTWTAWIPLGDCPRELGTLAVLPGSHKQGLLSVHKAEGAGGHACDNVSNDDWASADLSCGDVLCIHSYLIHQGQDNQTDRQLRLSMDIRFQDRTKLINQSSLQPHMHFLEWDEVYANWNECDELKYYWKDFDLDIEA